MNWLSDIIKNLDKYIEENYFQKYDKASNEKNAEQDIIKTAEFTDRDAKNIEELMSELGESFQEMLFRKIREVGLSESDVYKRANIDRKLFSKIRSNPIYHTRKNTVLALAIALKLDMDETVELLEKAGYALSPGNKGDLIVRYFIERKVYDIDVINYALLAFKQPILGGKM